MAKFKESLKEKITDEKVFNDILVEAAYDNKSYVPGEYSGRDYYYGIEYLHDGNASTETLMPAFRSIGVLTKHVDKRRWWLVREWLRLRYNVYELTDTLRRVNEQFPEIALHCANDGDDPAMVAYTPDHEKGIRDIQVRISLGRLLRKLYPQIPDEVVAATEADHRAAMSDEVEFLAWGDDFLKAYREACPACMSKSRSSYGSEHHPTEAYDVPWLRLATIRNGEGKFSARALTYVSPDNPEDKRYVRIYGDAMMERRLKKRGYRCAGLEGVRLKKIPVGATTYVMPYIDNPAHNPNGELCAQYAVHDGDYLAMVSKRTAEAVSRASGYSASPCTSTTGAVNVPAQSTLDSAMVTCAFSGVRFVPHINTNAVVIRGALAWVHPNEKARVKDWAEVYGIISGKSEGKFLKVDPETATFVVDGTTYLDNTFTRGALGYALLDPVLYEGAGWVKSGLAAVTSDGNTIRAVDAVDLVVMRDGEVRHNIAHASQVPEKSVKVHRINSTRPTFVAPGVPTLKTIGGKTVVMAVHPVVELVDGRIEFVSKTVKHRVLGINLYTLEDQLLSSVPNDKFMERIEPTLVARTHNYLRGMVGDWGKSEVVHMERLEAAALSAYRGIYYSILCRESTNSSGRVDYSAAMNGGARANARSIWKEALAVADEVLASSDTSPEMMQKQREAMVMRRMHAAAGEYLSANDIKYELGVGPKTTAKKTPAPDTAPAAQQRYVIAA